MKTFKQFFKEEKHYEDLLKPRTLCAELIDKLSRQPFDFTITGSFEDWVPNRQDKYLLGVKKITSNTVSVFIEEHGFPTDKPTVFADAFLFNIMGRSSGSEIYFEVGFPSFCLDPSYIHQAPFFYDNYQFGIRYFSADRIIQELSSHFIIFNFYISLDETEDLNIKYIKTMDMILANAELKSDIFGPMEDAADGVINNYLKFKRKILGDESLTTDNWIDMGMSDI